MSLLGIPWMYGYFILDTDKTLIFSYINSSQGTILFCFHCIASKGVRNEIIKYVCPASNTTLVLSHNSKKISKTNSATQNSVSIKRATYTTNVPALALTAQADVTTPTPTTLPLNTRPATQNSETIKRETYTTYFDLIPNNCQQEHVKFS